MLKEEIEKDLKNALKNGESSKVSALRFLLSKVKNKEIEKQGDLDNEDIHSLIQTLVKQGKESISMFEEGGRSELVQEEEERIEILMSYMPEQMNDEEIRALVSEIIEEVGASGMEDMGKVMGPAMERVGSQAEGSKVSEIVREELS